MLTNDELRKLTVQDLDKELNDIIKKLFTINFEVRTGSSKANHEIGNLRKYCARIKTIKHEIERTEKANLSKQHVVEKTS